MRLSIGAQDYVIKSMCEKPVKHVYRTFSITLLILVNLSSRVPRTLPALHVWNYQHGAWKGRICEYHTMVGRNGQLTFFNELFSMVRACGHVSVTAHARVDIAGSASWLSMPRGAALWFILVSQPRFSASASVQRPWLASDVSSWCLTENQWSRIWNTATTATSALYLFFSGHLDAFQHRFTSCWLTACTHL